MHTNKKEASHSSKHDWIKIKYEFISEEMTMRELSRKYNVAVSAISTRAKKEGWVKQQGKIKEQTDARLEQKAIDHRVSNTERAMNCIDTLLVKIEKGVKTINPKDIGAIKSMVASLKDLRDLGVYEVTDKAGADIKVEMGEEASEYAD